MPVNEIKVLRSFQRNLVQFLDDLIRSFPDEPNLLIARIFIADRVPILDVMSHFIEHILPLKRFVDTRDDKFFLENRVLFEELNDDDSVNHFKKIWLSGDLDDDNRDAIWKWFDRFIQISETYQKVKLLQIRSQKNHDN